MVLLSGYRSELYDVLFSGWSRLEHEAFTDGAGRATECLWLNPAAQANAAQLSLQLSRETA